MTHGPTMPPRMPGRMPGRAVALLVGGALLGGLLVGCGGEAKPEAPSVKDRHCEAYRDFFEERASHDRKVSDAEVVSTLKGWGGDLAEIGPPDDMPDDAREGHAIWVDLIGQVDHDATKREVVGLEEDLSRQELEQVEAFFAYNDSSCLGSPPVEDEQPAD